jgi:hypothetical protein
VNLGSSDGWFGDPREYFEKCAFSGAIPSDHSDNIAALDIE